jgi:rhamnosyltransferase|tara:strand:+ start:3171 stop:4076 length:906 start_codon:yes stop_codon:yes gene_type:complete
VSIAAAIVTYHPDIDKLNSVIKAVLPQVQHVALLDNTDDESSAARIRYGAPAGVSYHWLGGNKGVAAAHNTAIHLARNRGMDFLLLLDQDSVPDPDMIRHLEHAHRSLTHQHVKVAAVGPAYRDQKTGSESFFIKLGLMASRRYFPSLLPHDAIVPSDTLISSGTLMALDTIDKVGQMDESLFIDHIDTEWFLRAASMGYTAFGVCAAKMTHSLGERLVNVWLGRWRTVPVHPAFRIYYIFRNSIALYKRDYTPLRWIVFDIKRLILMVLLFGLFVGDRFEQIAMIAKGLQHGLSNRSGAL